MAQMADLITINIVQNAVRGGCQWVKVDDELPGWSSRFLVWLEDKGVHMEVAEYKARDKKFFVNGECVYPTHWIFIKSPEYEDA